MSAAGHPGYEGSVRRSSHRRRPGRRFPVVAERPRPGADPRTESHFTPGETHNAMPEILAQQKSDKLSLWMWEQPTAANAPLRPREVALLVHVHDVPAIVGQDDGCAHPGRDAAGGWTAIPTDDDDGAVAAAALGD